MSNERFQREETSDPLDEFLERVEQLPTRLPNGNRRYYVVDSHGTVRPAKRGLLGRAPEGRYYVLQADTEIACPPIVTRIADQTGREHRIDILAHIQGVETGRDAEVVRALSRERRPFTSLEVLVLRWLNGFVKQRSAHGIDLVRRFAASLEDGTKAREDGAAAVARLARQRIGLLLDCTLRLPEAELIVEQIILDSLPVLVSDSDENLSVRLELTVHPPATPEGRDFALQRSVPMSEIKNEVAVRVGDWFRAECTLDLFCFDRVCVRARLQDVLRGYIEGELHRRLFGFRVICRVPFPTDFDVAEDYLVKSRVEPAQTEIPVHHKILLKRENIAQFREANITDLETFLRKLLEKVTGSVLFEKTYGDVLLKFEDIRNDIKRRVSEVVQGIGFSVSQLITIPEDPHMRDVLDKVMTFVTETKEVPTRDTRVPFGLSIQARVLLTDLEQIRPYLRPGDFLRNEMKRISLDEASQKVRELMPEDLHTRFSEKIVRPGTNGAFSEQPSPEDQIKSAIATALKKKMGLDIENILVTPESTDLSRVHALICHARPREVPVTVQTMGSKGEDVTFNVYYRVSGIAFGRWSSFEELCRNCGDVPFEMKATMILDAVDALVRNLARAELSHFQGPFLQSSNPEIMRMLENRVTRMVIDTVVEEHGLVLSNVHWIRERSFWESNEAKRLRAQEAILDAELNETRRAWRQLLLERGANDPDVIDLGEQVREYEREIRDRFGTDHDETVKETAAALPKVNRATLLPPVADAKSTAVANVAEIVEHEEVEGQ